MGIRLSKERGLDPILSTCFVCGKENKGLVLTGTMGKRIRNEAGAHSEASSLCFDKVPCDECVSIMEEAVIFISCKDEDEGSKNPYRTGGWSALKLEAVKRNMPNLPIDKNRVYFVPDSIYDKMGLPRNEEIDNRNHHAL